MTNDSGVLFCLFCFVFSSGSIFTQDCLKALVFQHFNRFRNKQSLSTIPPTFISGLIHTIFCLTCTVHISDYVIRDTPHNAQVLSVNNSTVYFVNKFGKKESTLKVWVFKSHNSHMLHVRLNNISECASCIIILFGVSMPVKAFGSYRVVKRCASLHWIKAKIFFKHLMRK